MQTQSVTVTGCIAYLNQVLNKAVMDGQTWYDTADEGVEDKVKLLRVSGAIAHHPVVHTLIRFQE